MTLPFGQVTRRWWLTPLTMVVLGGGMIIASTIGRNYSSLPGEVVIVIVATILFVVLARRPTSDLGAVIGGAPDERQLDIQLRATQLRGSAWRSSFSSEPWSNLRWATADSHGYRWVPRSPPSTWASFFSFGDPDAERFDGRGNLFDRIDGRAVLEQIAQDFGWRVHSISENGHPWAAQLFQGLDSSSSRHEKRFE